MQFIKLILSVFLLLTFWACTPAEDEQADHADHMEHADHTDGDGHLDHADDMSMSEGEAMMQDEVIDLPTEQQQQIIEQYLALKDALVQSDAEMAAKNAGELAKSTGGQQADVLENLREAAVLLADTDDLEVQREYFERISGKVYILAKANPDHPPLYRQYCPMAFDNTGAYWLAAEEEINNPYFGDKMLRCGEVEEEI